MIRPNKRTRTEFVSGILAWARVVKPDTQFNCWSVRLYPNAESLDKIRKWQTEGLKNVIRNDQDGDYVRFKCDVSRQRRDGSIWTFEAPKVVDAEGRPMDGSIIGNGSSGTIKLEVYEHNTPGGGKAIAARLIGIKIDALVPFNPDFDDAKGDLTDKELMKQPSALVTW